MESDYFNISVLSLKKPLEKQQLLQNLIVIRRGIDGRLQNIQLLNESGIVKNLIGYLQLESCSVLDVTLSILGNCCIDSSFSRNLFKLNILHSLNRLLEKHRKDSIVGRVFRIIGNMCGNVCTATMIIKEPLLFDKIVNILKDTSKRDINSTDQVSEATMLMALRTIRKLLKKSTLERLIVKYQILNAVGMVLIKCVDQWEVDKSNEPVLQEILKLLQIYSRYAHPCLIKSLKNTENGDSLLYLGKVVVLNPSRVIKIIANLNRYCLLKSDLPIATIWEKLLEETKLNMPENTYMECLKSMHKLVDYPSYREYLKLGDTILHLVNMVKEFTVRTDFSMKCCTVILSILNKCQYDDTLVQKQISLDMVNIVIEKLEWAGISSATILMPNHARKKRKGKHLLENNKRIKQIMDCFSYNMDPSVPYEDRCASPSSETSEISSNGPNSPTSTIINEDVSDSDNYSPVCSDIEDTDIKSLPSSISPIGINYPSSSDDEEMTDFNDRIKHRFLHEIIDILLWRYSHMQPVIMELGSSKLLTALLNIALSCEFPCTSRQLLMSILSKTEYLIPLMQTNFVQMVYNLMLTEHNTKICKICNNAYEISFNILNGLTKVAESGGGKGDIAHILLRSNGQNKCKIAVAIPYIIRNKYITSKLLLNCGGLDILLKLLEEKSDTQEDSINCLCVLAHYQLKIKNPVTSQPLKQLCNFDINNYSISDTCENIVNFKLDDGNIVMADRDFLSSKSDYFNRLLNGHFKESEQSEITLQSITTKSLKFLLLLLYSHIPSLGLVSIDLDTLLDLLEITERYLLVEINVYLSACVEQLHMSNKTVPTIYQWSIESGTNILRVETIAFALVGDILEKNRIEMFHDLLSLGYYKQLRDDIQKLLVRFLR